MEGFNSIEILNGVSDEFIASAEKAGSSRKLWRIALPAAAGLCLAIGTIFALSRGLSKDLTGKNEIVASASQKPAETGIITVTSEPTETAAADPEADRLYLSPVSASDDYTGETSEQLQWGIDYKMFIYHGKVYFHFMNLDPSVDVIGDKVCTVDEFDFQYTANFSYDEGSGSADTSEAHPYISISENELKGSVWGNVFSVKGYDPETMLCMRNVSFSTVELYLYDGDIPEKNGGAFLSDVLNIGEHLDALRYSSHTGSSYLYEIEAGSEAVGLFMDALYEGEWVNDTRSVTSRYFSEAEFDQYHTADPDLGVFGITLKMDNGFDLDLRVYVDNIVAFPYSFNSRALKVDPEKIVPLIELMENDSGKCLRRNSEEKLAVLKNNERFGEMVPSLIPKGYYIRNYVIDSVSDPDTGRIIRTNNVHYEYRNPSSDALIYIWIQPIERMEEDRSIIGGIERGAKVVDAAEFDTSCMYIDNSLNDVYSVAIVTYKDAVIYVEAFSAKPKTVESIIKSIGE